MLHSPIFCDLILPSIDIGSSKTSSITLNGMPTWVGLLLRLILLVVQVMYNGICHLVSLDYFLTYNLAYVLIMVIPLGLLYMLIIFTKAPIKESSSALWNAADVGANRLLTLDSTERLTQTENTQYTRLNTL